MVIKKKISIDVKIYSILIILLPFLFQYKAIWSLISLGELLLMMVLFLIFFNHKGKLLVVADWYLTSFYYMTFFTTIMSIGLPYFSFPSALTLFVRLIFYAIIINVARTHFSFDYVKDFYYVLLLIFSTYLLVQFYYHIITGDYLPIYIKYSWLMKSEARAQSLITYYQGKGYRASSLFLEPSYFSLFSLPGVCFLLYKKKKKKIDIITLLVTSIALVLSGAASGVAGLIIILFFYIFKESKNKKSSNTFEGVLLVFIIIGIIFGYILFSESGTSLVNRLIFGGSFNDRVTRGILVYGELPIYQKIFGVGLNNLKTYRLSYNITTIYDNSELSGYTNSLVGTLNSSGIVGFIALLLYLLHLRKKVVLYDRYKFVKSSTKIGSSIGISLFWIFVFVMSYEAILFTYRFAFLLIILESSVRSKLRLD